MYASNSRINIESNGEKNYWDFPVMEQNLHLSNEREYTNHEQLFKIIEQQKQNNVLLVGFGI